MGELTDGSRIEQELERAQAMGRWLSDDELKAEAEQNAIKEAGEAERLSRRRRLTVLTAVCVLIPPLWPVAIGLTLYLLFPRTATGLFLTAGISAIVVFMAGLGLSVLLAVWLINLLL